LTDLHTLAIADLVPHPDNPRLQMREDVVERIAAEIGRYGFGREHALLIRPKGGTYQILSGHHRVEAAKRAGLAEVPCWVKDLDDDEAFMQLVLANTQGELSPLEEGKHLSRYEQGVGGRGQKGGIREYARRLGKDESGLRQRRDAYRVYENCGHVSAVSEMYRHLYEISKAPEVARPFLVERLAAKGWTVAETASQVEKIRAFKISDLDADWLSLAKVTERFLASGKPSPAAVEQLAAAAYTVYKAITDRGDDDAHADEDAFHAWLVEHAGRESWDRKEIGNYHVALIRKWAERDAAAAQAAAEDEPRLPDGIDLRHGDFRDVLAELSGVDAIITDPPYPEEFLPLFADLSYVAAQALKPGGICAVMVGQSYLPQIIDALGTNLAYHWTLAYLTPGGQAVQLWQRKVNTFWKPVLIYVNGEYAGEWLGDVTRSDVNDNDKQHHHWGQSESGMADLINRLTRPGQLVCDPFLGGGTTAVVAHALGRQFIGCDTDETCIAVATARFTTAEDAAALWATPAIAGAA